ncbi:22831_t:CDS:1 [Dentiscutata erythropus]|uniref:22831_t:CDS:1 n=1 Tax=Dentiscutata erythropus TaxID=1348616 RepID=A0A9N9NK53_9GLOM|nr:22831_t:CDS:1 [Dentiscutata erythropus]
MPNNYSIGFFQVDLNYDSHQDTLVGVFSTLMPLVFLLLFTISQDENSSWKTNFLPILDDLLYNIITWVIPLIISIIYDSRNKRIFAICNAIPHILCIIISYCKNKKLNVNSTNKHSEIDADDYPFLIGEIFIAFIPITVIPTFWLIHLSRNENANIEANVKKGFIILFSLIIFLTITLIITICLIPKKIPSRLISLAALTTLCLPGLLQTLLIMLTQPVNSLFFKVLLFLLITFLSRISTYFVEKFPYNLRATPTTYVLYVAHQFRMTINKSERTLEEVESRVAALEKDIERVKSSS